MWNMSNEKDFVKQNQQSYANKYKPVSVYLDR